MILKQWTNNHFGSELFPPSSDEGFQGHGFIVPVAPSIGTLGATQAGSIGSSATKEEEILVGWFIGWLVG
jgi:hypothetical protein